MSKTLQGHLYRVSDDKNLQQLELEWQLQQPLKLLQQQLQLTTTTTINTGKQQQQLQLLQQPLQLLQQQLQLTTTTAITTGSSSNNYNYNYCNNTATTFTTTYCCYYYYDCHRSQWRGTIIQLLTPLLEAANCSILATEPRLRRWSLVRPLTTPTSIMSNASGATTAELM